MLSKHLFLLTLALFTSLSTLCFPSFSADHSDKDPLQLRFLSWDHLPSLPKQFEQLAAKHDLNVKLVLVKPPLTNEHSAFNALRGDMADVLLAGSYVFDDFYARVPLPSNQDNADRIFKLLHPLDLSLLSNYANLQPVMTHARFDIYQKQKYSIPHSATKLRLLYNKKFVSTPPTSFLVLVNPENQGKISTSGVVENSLIPLLMGMGFSAYEAQEYNLFRFKLPYLQALTNQLLMNKRYFWHQINDIDKMSELSYTTSWGRELLAAKEAGQQWQLADVPGIHTLDTLVIAKKLAEHPQKLKAAYLLIDYLISGSYQTQLVRASPYTYPSNRIVAKHLTDEELACSGADDPNYFDEMYMLRYRDSRTNNMYQRIWRTAIEYSQKQNQPKSRQDTFSAYSPTKLPQQ